MKILRVSVLILCILAAAIVPTFAKGNGEGNTGSSVSQGNTGIIPEHIPEVDVMVQDGESLQLVATTSIIGDVIRNIIGDKANLVVLMEPGINPHNFQPTPADFRAIEEADLVFINGLDLEEGLLDDLAAAARGGIIPVSDGIQAAGISGEGEEPEDEHDDVGEDEDGHDHEHGETDPHVWLNPLNILTWVDNITDVLTSADPEHASVYIEHADSYKEQILILDQEIEHMLSGIPAARKLLVTDHYLMTYFADRYGFTIVGTVIRGTSSSAEPSARDIAELSGIVKEQGVTTIFISATASGSLAKLSTVLADEVGAEIDIQPILSGSLAAGDEPGSSYLELMRFNAAQVASAFMKE